MAIYLPHSLEDFRMFVDVKIGRSMGGNNALLYACTSGSSQIIQDTASEGGGEFGEDQANYMLVRYMID